MHEVNVTKNSVNFNRRLTLPPRYRSKGNDALWLGR